MGHSHWLHCEKGPAEAVLPSPAEEVKPATGAAETVLLCYHWIRLCTSITVWFSSATKSDFKRLRRVVRTAERIIGTTLPSLQELYLSRVSKSAGKITLYPSHQHTHSLNCYRLVDATELWAPERPDTGTVSSLRQSISWTLDIKRGTHTIYTHTTFKCAHTCAYNCQFVYCYSLFYFYSFIICVFVLSFCRTAVASVTVTNSSYV